MKTTNEITCVKILQDSAESRAYETCLSFNPERFIINRKNNTVTLEIALLNCDYNKVGLKNISTEEHTILLYQITDKTGVSTTSEPPKFIYKDVFSLDNIEPQITHKKPIAIIVFVDNQKISTETISQIQKKTIKAIKEKKISFCIDLIGLIPKDACGGILGEI